MTREEAINWLKDCTKYFEFKKQATEEDIVYWASLYNAENAKEIIKLLEEGN